MKNRDLPMQDPIEPIEPTRFQVNPQLDGDVAQAFNLYMEQSGVNSRSAVAHSLIVQGLRKLGYLPSVSAKGAVSLQPVA